MLVEQVHWLIWKVLNVLRLAPTQLLLMMVIKISIDVDFEKTNEDASGYFIASRLIPSINKASITYVAPQCANGYTSGAMGLQLAVVTLLLTVQMFMLVLQRD